MLHHTMTFSTILCYQLCGNSLGKAFSCFSMTMPLCTKRGPYRNGLSRSVWKNLTGLHRALTLTPSNIFAINWNEHCEPGLIAQHQCQTSLMLVAEWKQVPASSRKPSQKSGGCYISKGDQNEMFNKQVSTYFWSCSVYSVEMCSF